MNDLTMLLPGLILFLSAGIAAITVLTMRGHLRSDALAAAPSRRVGLHPLDLLAGFLLIGIGQIGTHALAVALGLLPPDAQAPTESPFHYAMIALLSQIGIAIPIVIYLFLRITPRPRAFRRFGLIPRNPVRETRLAGMALLAAVPIVLASGMVSSVIGALLGEPPPEVAHEMLHVLTESQSIPANILMIIAAVLVAPLVEELIYRGMVQTSLLSALGPNHRWAVVWIAAGLFALVHVEAAAWQGLPGLLILGVMLGYLYEKTGSLLPCILVHAGFNAINVALTLLLIRLAP